jgi:hypothetical protein
MARTTLKLGSNATAWTDGVRHGRLLYPDGHEVPVLVRPSALESSPGTLHDAREDAALVGHVGHPGVLPIEQVVGVHGRIAHVYAHFDGVSLPRLVETLQARGHAVPVRVAVEIAAAVAVVLQQAVDTLGTGEAVAAPDPLGVDVLIGSHGQIRLAGLRVVAGGAGDARASAAATGVAWLVAELLGGERPGRGSANAEAALARIVEVGANASLVRALGEVLLVGGGAETGPGALGASLLAVAPQQPGPSLAAWAPASISLALRDANAAGGPLPAESGARPDPARAVTPSMPLPEASAAYARPAPVPAPGGGVAEGGGPPSAPFLALPAEESIDFTLPGTPLSPEVRAALGGPVVSAPAPAPAPTAASSGGPPPAPVAARGAAATTVPSAGPRMQMLLPEGDDDVEATVIGMLKPVEEAVFVPPPARNEDPFEISTIGALPTGPVEPSRWDSLGEVLQAPPAPPPPPPAASDPLRRTAVAAAAVALLAVAWAASVLSDEDAPRATADAPAEAQGDAPAGAGPDAAAPPTEAAPGAPVAEAPAPPPAASADEAAPQDAAPAAPAPAAPPATVWATPSPQPAPVTAPTSPRANPERERDSERAERRERAERERDAADKAAREARAERERTERTAREKAERDAADRAAREKAERDAADRAAREKAERDAADRAAREKAEREKARAAAAPAPPADAAPAASPGPFTVTFRNGNDLVTKISVTCNRMPRPAMSEEGAVTLPDVPRGPCTVVGIIPGTTPRRTSVLAVSDGTWTCFKGDSNSCTQ